jgi:hypothetical protein
MPRSPKIPPTPDPLDLVNHIRKCSLEEFRIKLEEVRHYYPDKYVVLVDFLLSCKQKDYGTTE